MELILEKEKVIGIMQEFGYTMVATLSDDKIIRFSKPTDINFSLYAEVNLVRGDVMINMVELPVYINSFWFDFFSGMFPHKEAIILEAAKALKILGKPKWKKKEKDPVVEEAKKALTLEEKRKAFAQEIWQVAKDKGYPKEMCAAFYKYWTELNPAKTKMRMDMEKTFEADRRMLTWAQRDKNFKSPAILRKEEQDKKAGPQDIINKEDLF